MTYADFLKAGVDFATGGILGETIGYKSVGGISESLSRFRDVAAVVDRHPPNVGISADRGREAIVVVISKTDLAAVHRGTDRIRVDGGEYVLERVLSEDDGGWELYFV